MKTIGLIGGFSWHSTEIYYREINLLTGERLGEENSAKILLYSVNLKEFTTLQAEGGWEKIGVKLSDIAVRLENAGADCILICANTPHLVADVIQKKIKIPLIHIAEETAKEIIKQNINKVGLLGTKFTMEDSFFKDRLTKNGIQAIIPGDEDREFIHSAIFNELTNGIFKKETKTKFLEIIEKLKKEGAQGIIFGCTEIILLIKKDECNITVFDTTEIHPKSAVDFALNSE